MFAISFVPDGAPLLTIIGLGILGVISVSKLLR
jgi:hypothetical protein